MPRISITHRSAVFGTVLAIGATTLFGGAAPAHATHASPGGRVTASNGGHYITVAGGNLVGTPEYTITDAAWSPDGSRAVFVTDNGDIATIRYNDGESLYPIANPDPSSQRADPEWVGDGSTVVWAARSAGEPWRIEETLSTYGFDIVTRSPDDGHHYTQPDTNDSQRVVVQRQADDGNGNPTGTPEIGFLDGSTYTPIVSDATSPTLSPDGQKVAFVRGNQIWVSDTSGNNLVQVTGNASSHGDPVWYPTGQTLAFRQGSGIAAAAADGSQQNPTNIAGITGEPDVQPNKKDRVVRLSGTDRFTTAVAISQSHWATRGNAADKRAPADSVVLTRWDSFADALGGSALAAAKQGPLLMSTLDTLHPTATAEMQRILAPGKTVYLLGSAAGAISANVEQQVKALGYNTVRLAGTDRFATSVAIANAIDPTPDTVLVATGMDFPDALSAGAAAGAQNLPGKGTSAVVVLTNNNLLPAPTKTYLDGLSGSSTVVGVGLSGATAAQPYDAIPLYGDSRWETALLTAWTFFGGQNHIGVTTGMNWPDALAGGALMASLDGPLLLTYGTDDVPGYEVEMLADETSGSVHTGLIFGSAPVVNDLEAQNLGYYLAGPNSYNLLANQTDVVRSTGGTAGPAQRGGAGAVDGPRTRAELKAAAEAARERLAD
ncbi:cell wall-binding repeat-containing protein [Micromonospora cathayae]|uniref:Cell wall-binding repeat-containing protein n=1 Tax=Micromonospora cathayae TaxID=3028804 RepID=A0ABY7ZTG5_9ACTN|nr:cell wall-binding repeat-containing protein [Micromonospora sp. HUAS 3]WDZ86101.1 cell wall-binding repeat-containing protein [Micromonospora sp. HUAS 3]